MQTHVQAMIALKVMSHILFYIDKASSIDIDISVVSRRSTRILVIYDDI